MFFEFYDEEEMADESQDLLPLVCTTPTSSLPATYFKPPLTQFRFSGIGFTVFELLTPLHAPR